jgi:hypothetical protein
MSASTSAPGIRSSGLAPSHAGLQFRRKVTVRVAVAAALFIAAAQPAEQRPAAPHWPVGATILVSIDPRRAPNVAPAFVERAMKTWTDAAAGRFTLKKATRADEAPLRIRFVSSDAVFGEARPRLDPQSGAIVAAEVAINADIVGDELQQQIIVYLTALHELGHALGLPHTDVFETIMYSFRRPDDGVRYFAAYRQRLRSVDDIGSPGATGLAAADVAALRTLYDRIKP